MQDPIHSDQHCSFSCPIAAALSSACLPCVACREFVISQYAELKKANPGLPILVREADGAEARITARYGAAGAHRARLLAVPLI